MVEEDVRDQVCIAHQSGFLSAFYLNLERQLIKLQDNAIVSEVRMTRWRHDAKLLPLER